MLLLKRERSRSLTADRKPFNSPSVPSVETRRQHPACPIISLTSHDPTDILVPQCRTGQASPAHAVLLPVILSWHLGCATCNLVRLPGPSWSLRPGAGQGLSSVRSTTHDSKTYCSGTLPERLTPRGLIVARRSARPFFSFFYPRTSMAAYLWVGIRLPTEDSPTSGPSTFPHITFVWKQFFAGGFLLLSFMFQQFCFLVDRENCRWS